VYKRRRRAKAAPAGNEQLVQLERQRVRPETRAQMLERLTNPLISLHEASVLLRVCPATVRRYSDNGLLAAERTDGGQRRFHLKDVLALMRQLEAKGK
jgi:excisionase family DNA binding protein